MEDDWENFLKFREIELKKNGRVNILMDIFDEEKDLVFQNGPKKVMVETLKNFSMSNFEKDFTLPEVLRSLEEFKMPFDKKLTDLTWEREETMRISLPIVAEFRKD